MKLVLFEWKLIMRNKRLRQQFLLFILCFPLMSYGQLFGRLAQDYFLIKEFWLFFVFALPFTWTTYAFGIQAAFIEKSLTTPLSMFDILQSKYRFFSTLSILLFLLYLPSLFFGVKLTELAATLIFAVGFFACGLFVSALFTYKTFDIKSSTFANYQGNDAGSYFFPLLVLVVALALVLVPFWLFGENIALIIMSVIGLIFIATHKIWLKFIAKKFYETKYKRLEKFREK